MTAQIIRTREELAALDHEAILSDSAGPYTASYAVAGIYDEDYEARDYLPAVVIATGDHVRAARQALEDADAVD